MSHASETTLGRALMLAGVTGLRAALGPALLSASRRSEGHQALALAAMGEMVVDKLPITPSRSSLPLLLPRILAGYWVASEVAREDGNRDPMIGLAGAATAAGVSLIAPQLRWTLRRAFGVPDPLLGALEDALAIYLGSLATGLSDDDLKHVASEAVAELREGRIAPALQQLGGRLVPSR